MTPVPSNIADTRQSASLQDHGAFEQLVRHNHGKVFAVAVAWLRDGDSAEDLTQEVFLRAYLFLHQGNTIEDFSAWCGTVARNLASKWLRSGRRRSDVTAKLSQMGISMTSNDSKNPRNEAEAAQETDHRQEALYRLDPAQREIVILHFMEGCSKSEIARMMGQHRMALS